MIDILQKEKLTAHSIAFLDRIDENKAWRKLSDNIQSSDNIRPSDNISLHPAGRVLHMRFLRYAAVLAGILLLGAASLLLLKRSNLPQPVIAGKYITEPVDHKKALLVLDDGRRIELDKNPDSSIRQGQVEIRNTDTALLRYTAATGAIQPAGFNTLVVPRGGEYKIELADGSEVWLNAETQLRYPAHFGGVTQRVVYLERGEAYFKVAPDAQRPFVVRAGGMDIHVLGTEFNVNTYTKNYATTLVNGAVRVNAGNAAMVLRPDQQALYTEGGLTATTVDVETYTAWKDGQMIFTESPLEEVMNTLGRQYDYTVEFTSPGLKERKFGGRLRRTQHIEDVLAIIGNVGNVEFSIRGKTIFVANTLSK